MSTSLGSGRFPYFGVFVAGCVLLGLAACQTSPPPAEVPPTLAVAPEPAAIPPGAKTYSVVPEKSLLQILVYRGGAMAKLGHNHVISSHRLSGAVYVLDDPTLMRFDVGFPVNELTIDEPVMREMAGSDFPPNVPQSARDGTRTNLLSEALLDGAKYPEIRLRATEVVAAGEIFDVAVEIRIKDQVRTVRVPVTLERTEGALKASGEFPLKQSDLGLKPFSVAMGTLIVIDEMKVRFEVTAKE